MSAERTLIRGKWTEEDRQTVARLAQLHLTPAEIAARVGRPASSIYDLRQRYPEFWETRSSGPVSPAFETPHYRSRTGVSLPLVSILQSEAR